jgi:predicted RND superfamily exporter protein
MKRPEVLRAIAGVEDALENHRLVTSATSLSDLVAEAHHAFSGGGTSARAIPNSQALVAQYLSMLDPIDSADFVTTDYARSHLAFLLKDEGSEPTRQFAEELQRIVDAANFSQYGIQAELTGNGVVAYQELDRAVLELIYGFVLAFVLIVVTQLVVFRSPRIALLSVLPNLLPVIGCLAALRWLGIDLKGDNSLVLCVSIGGLFNTTIQFVARALQRLAETNDAPGAVIDHALRAVGPAAIFTVGTLSAGFSVLLLSDFPGLRALGGLSMLTLILGLFSDLIVTPALFYSWYVMKKSAVPAARPTEAVSAAK